MDNPWDGRERRRLPEPTRTIIMDGTQFERLMSGWMEQVESLSGKIESLDRTVNDLKDTQPAALATALASVLTDETVMRNMVKAGRKVMDEDSSRALGDYIKSMLRAMLLKGLPVAASGVLVVEGARRIWQYITHQAPP